MSATPLVLVVDDEALVRSSVDSLLRSVGYRVNSYATPLDLWENQARLLEADCLILDVRLPFTSGLELQKKLVEMGCDVPVVFLTGYGDIPMSVRAMKAGAADFLPKPFRDQDMLDAVATACMLRASTKGESRKSDELKQRFSSLTPRERQIMKMATKGLMNKQIAGELDLSEITVKIHRGKIMRKMMAKTFADLVKMAESIDRIGGTSADRQIRV
jgi:FixJ family two-component response regulator